MRITIVGGSFDDNGGRPSGLVNKLADALQAHTPQPIYVFNGGHYDVLESILTSQLNGVEAVIWMPNVPNDKPKIRNIKELHPKILLVSSKYNEGPPQYPKYSTMYLINHALGMKANLMIEFTVGLALQGSPKPFRMQLLDPLCNQWAYTADIQSLASSLMSRLYFLKDVTRVGTERLGEAIEVPDQSEFFEIVRLHAKTFHELIHPADGVERFLGNSSFRAEGGRSMVKGEFRCENGFPSFRQGDWAFVSRRNLDKRDIGREGFVAAKTYHGNKIGYYGDHKPSVDTPIQLWLYNRMPNINYMIHSHVYVFDAPFRSIGMDETGSHSVGVCTTTNRIPCGALEEAHEIWRSCHLSPDTNEFAINLKGHGCLVAGATLDIFNQVKYIARSYPEPVSVPLDYGPRPVG